MSALDGARVLASYGCPRWRTWTEATGRAAVRRYERSRPGELVHVDVKKLGNIPDGGGWRTAGLGPGPQATAGPPRPARRKRSHPVWATATCTPPWTTTPGWPTPRSCPTRRKDTAAAFLARAHAWFAAAGITIERVISDNGSCYRSRTWAAACADLGIIHKRTRPYRPQTNGKVERFHRTLADEWAYARPYATETERRAALDPWLHTYNHHRGHTALKGHPPASRVTNLSGQNT